MIHLPPLTDKQSQILDGSLLGDGCIASTASARHNCGFHKIQRRDREDYLNWMMTELAPYALGVSRSRSPKPVREGDTLRYSKTEFCESSTLYTTRHPVFTQLRERWYPGGVKSVPTDLQLTPLSLAVWFCDDGTNVAAHRFACFYTDSFTTADAERLALGVAEFGIRCSVIHRHSKPVIRVWSESYLDFISLVKPFIPWASMAHKIATEEYTVPRRSSRVRGVDWVQRYNRWQARKCVAGKRYHLGTFGSEEEAIAAVENFTPPVSE